MKKIKLLSERFLFILLYSCATQKNNFEGVDVIQTGLYNTYMVTYKDNTNQYLRYPENWDLIYMMDSSDVQNILKIDTLSFKQPIYNK